MLALKGSAAHHPTVPHHLPTGTLTFLFTDIEGSTRLLLRLGDRYKNLLERHGSIVRSALLAHGGVEVGTEGDSFFAVFSIASQAVAACVMAQRSLAEEPWPDGSTVRVRMGMHTGEGRLGGDSYAGLDVHRAARIASVRARRPGPVVGDDQVACRGRAADGRVPSGAGRLSTQGSRPR